MRGDPYDKMLLTNRPTTVVTQHTSMLDTFPTPYGSPGEEAGIFAGIGDDDGMAANAAAQQNTALRTMAAVPAVVPSDVQALPTATVVAPAKIPAWALIGAAVAAAGLLGWFGKR